MPMIGSDQAYNGVGYSQAATPIPQRPNQVLANVAASDRGQSLCAWSLRELVQSRCVCTARSRYLREHGSRQLERSGILGLGSEHFQKIPGSPRAIRSNFEPRPSMSPTAYGSATRIRP